MSILNNDKYLFQKVKAGDHKSFEILFEKYYNKLCNYAFLYLKDVSKTEELVSDVYIRIWENRNKIEIKTNLKSYIYRSTRNAVISDMRKNKGPGLSLHKEYKSNEKFVDSPETLLIREEVADIFHKMMQKLPKQAGLVFRLHKMDGLSYKQIAEILDLSIKTVENHMGRALKLMRSMYDEIPDFFNE
jgi:RNA polymerase sigma-70 factor (ECF subfamily)